MITLATCNIAFAQQQNAISKVDSSAASLQPELDGLKTKIGQHKADSLQNSWNKKK
ncbi:MAG: hypothetical protein ACKOE5_03025 [Cytophagales bacterium]